MNSTIFVLLVTLWSIGLAYQVNERESLPPPKLPLRPGDLLRSLDELTSDAQVIYSPLQRTDKQSVERRAYNHDNEDAASEYDYDKAYEDFVSKYFANGEKDLENENDDDDSDGYEDEKAKELDDASPFTFESKEDDKSAAAKKRSSESKKCERVKLDGQSCVVCEDPESNEKSKTCSYSSESKPKSYKYNKERSTKNSSDNDDSSDSAEDRKSLKREITPNKEKYQPRRTSIKAFLKPIDETSNCTRKLEDDLVCFYCGSLSENTRECVADKNIQKKRRLDESSKKDSTKKKVFKRMVTYSFKNNDQPEIKSNTYASLKGY